MTFFEMSYEDWRRTQPADRRSREVWRVLSEQRWNIIRASSHYHGGISCRDYRDYLSCDRCTRQQVFE